MPVLISGAPRSGASLIAQALASKGVFLGDRFGNPDNRTSMDHLCDQDVVAFHTGLLERSGASWKDAATLSALPGQETEFASPVSDLVRKFQSHPLWGWKDSRAIFFLDAWTRFLPDAQWLFVVRRPTEIAWASAAGRVDRNSSRRVMAREALDLWVAYNQRLLEFVKRQPGRSTVLLLPDDLDQGLTGLQNRLPDAWRETLAEVDFSGIFNSYLMRAEVPRWVRLQAGLHPSAGRIWRDLQSLRAAKNPVALRRERSSFDPGEQRLVVFSQIRMAFSETFVQAHLQGLPAQVDWLLVDNNRTPRTNDEIPLYSLSERVRLGVMEALGARTYRYSTRAIKRYLKQHHIDGVLAEFGPVSVRVMEACKALGVPLVAHFHGADASRRTTLAEHREEYQRLFEVASALVVVSHDMEKRLKSLGAPPGKIHYNPCSVDVDEFYGAEPGKAPPAFLATGRYVNKKGPHLTLLAFARVLAVCPDARLTLVGDGVLRPVCEDLARTLGIAGAVKFIGFLPHTAIASLMREMRGFVQHSIDGFDGDAEGTPVAMMEAAATGLPILGTSHAGIKEVVQHGKTGFLVEPGDVESMASNWIALARDPALAQRMGAAGRKHIQESPFERSRSLANLWRIMSEVIPYSTD